MKRSFDIVLALTGLLVLLPVLLVVAILIKLDSDGPVFFRQERLGRDGRKFRIFKFRTMVVGAYKMGSRLTTRRDPRITPMGQILRWFKLDELPQLINVVLGDMSIVGPRPEDPYFLEFYTPEQRRVLSVRPGLLGPSQILGRDEVESYPEGLKDTEAYYVEHILPGKLARDLEYVASCSFAGDMALLARGVWAVLRGAVKAKALWRWRWRVALFALDTALIAASYWLAVLLRLDFAVPHGTRLYWRGLLIVIVVRAAALMYFGAYQIVFSYFGLWDLTALFKAVSLSAVIGGGLTFFLGLQAHSRSVFVIDGGLILLLLAAVRYTLRWVARQRSRKGGHKRHKALVAGAGIGGEQIARALLEDPLSPYRPVGFIDEAPDRWGALIHGVRVIGGPAELPLALSANGIKAVFVCISDLTDGAAREVVEMCQRGGIEYRLVPTLTNLLSAETFGPNGRGAGGAGASGG